MTGRNIDEYWWTWLEGEDWPSWYYGEKTAEDAQARLARSNLGRKVKIGKLQVHNSRMVKAELVFADD